MAVILEFPGNDPPPHVDLPSSLLGREPYKGHGYVEVELKNGRRGRLLKENGPKLVVHFYATGEDEEVLSKNVAKRVERHT